LFVEDHVSANLNFSFSGAPTAIGFLINCVADKKTFYAFGVQLSPIYLRDMNKSDGAENPQVGDIWFLSIPKFMGCCCGLAVAYSIQTVDGTCDCLSPQFKRDMLSI